jgi:DNA invertase Pin-like site-specific DNA recombinase
LRLLTKRRQKMVKIERTTPLRIHANLVVGLIHSAYDEGGDEEAVKVGKGCLGNVTDEQILKIARGEATLKGCTPGPITYEERRPPGTFRSGRLGGVMKAIGYCRVSDQKQVDNGVSLEAQEAKIQAWCELNDYELVAVYVDAGISGKAADNRPSLLTALDMACENEAALVVYSLSRLTRSTRDAINIAERLNKADADLVSISEKIDTTTAAGKMVFRILAVLAEFESDQISERTKLAMAHLKQNGKYTGGNAKYGYRNDEHGDLVEVASEQNVIRAIKTLAANAKGYNEIARFINGMGFRSRTGADFQAVQVRNILMRDQP